MSWLEALSDARPVTAIYGPDVPTLTGVSLHEVRFHRDGPRATLRFDLADYPATPPRKWAAQQANTVQLELALIGVESVHLTNWATTVVTDLSLTSDGGLVRLATTSGPISLAVDAESAAVTNISAYHDTDR